MGDTQYYIQSLDEIAKQRAVAYDKLSEFARNRVSWYRDRSKISLSKLLGKDVVMFASRGVATAEEFVEKPSTPAKAPARKRLWAQPCNPLSLPSPQIRSTRAI